MLRDHVGSGGVPEEDERSADWIHLLPSHERGLAVVVGAGLGAIPSALARQGRRVLVVDPSPVRLALARLRVTGEGLAIDVVRAASLAEIPVRSGAAELLAFVDPDRAGSDRVTWTAREAQRVLRRGGSLYWRAHHRRVFARGARVSLDAQVRALRDLGFTDVRAYAPLPDRGIPLFHVPLDAPGAMRHFLGAILPLVTTVSPEARRRYGAIARLATLATALARWPGAASAAGSLVPGTAVLARAGGSTAHAA